MYLFINTFLIAHIMFGFDLLHIKKIDYYSVMLKVYIAKKVSNTQSLKAFHFIF